MHAVFTCKEAKCIPLKNDVRSIMQFTFLGLRASGVRHLADGLARAPIRAFWTMVAGPDRRDSWRGRQQARRSCGENCGKYSAARTNSPNGIRTRVARMKIWCPRPLDDGTVQGGGMVLNLFRCASLPWLRGTVDGGLRWGSCDTGCCPSWSTLTIQRFYLRSGPPGVGTCPRSA